MTSKGSRKNTRKPASKATGGRGHAAGPRVVANPSALFQKMQPSVQLRSPLRPPIPSPGEEVLFDLHQRMGQRRAYALGLRYLLPSWYLDMGEEMLTRELLNEYKTERSTCLLYGDALLTF